MLSASTLVKNGLRGLVQLLWQKWFLITILTLSLIVGLMNAPWGKLLEKLDTKPLDELSIQGKPVFTRAEDIQDTLEKMGGLKGYFAQDIDDVKKQISQLPWIKRFVVHKKYPNQLTFWVVDYIPIAILNGTDFLSKEGVVFSLPKNRIMVKDLPDLYGSNEQVQILYNNWHTMNSILNKQNLRLKKLYLNPQGALELLLDNDILLKLGRKNWETRAKLFVRTYPAIRPPEDKRIIYVDLRYPAGMAVKFGD